MTLTKTDRKKRGISHEEYFRTVSPMCRRILDEMASVKESYGVEWENLPYADQCRIMDQTIVDEATVRRYESCGTPGPLNLEYFPKLKLATGQKIVSDEKLTARGYSCIWRDEHSAPFSWHTRSQMDLTLDTPPPTPTLTNETPPIDNESAQKSKTPKSESGSVFSGPVYRTQPFLWHYDPKCDPTPPDPPDLVIASSLSSVPSSEPLLSNRSSFNHVVVRDDNVAGVGGWVRGALNFFTGSCIPIHYTNKKAQLHPGSPFIHPELRPPHVIAKAAKVPPIAKPPSKPSRDVSKPSSSRDLSSIDTALTALDSTSEASLEGRLENSFYNKSFNRNSTYSCTSPSDVYTITEEQSTKNRKAAVNAELETVLYDKYQEQLNCDTEGPPSTSDGFDFLLNW